MDSKIFFRINTRKKRYLGNDESIVDPRMEPINREGL